MSARDSQSGGAPDAVVIEPLYRPRDAAHSRTARFLSRVNTRYGLRLDSYEDLHAWSIGGAHDPASLAHFWSEVWDEVGVVGEKGGHVVDLDAKPADNPAWFSEAKVNWAENMLRYRSETKVALIEAIEPTSALSSPPRRTLTYAALYELVADTVCALRAAGLRAGDRVASYSSNCIENIAACLASTAIGCIWVGAAAEFGPDGVLERLEQVRPTVLFASDAVAYNGKVHPHVPKVKTLVTGLAKNSIYPKVVIIESILGEHAPGDSSWESGWVGWKAFAREGASRRAPGSDIEWARLDFNWPLWILFSSGTTGRPKPIVHRAGGMLLQSMKEFVICADLTPDDVFFQYTQTGWMMWNFLVSTLAVGCTLVLYDGSPLKDPALLWRLCDDVGVSIFGTSAKYLDQLAKSYRPREHHALLPLRQIYSTGSPLAPTQYDYVYEHVKRDVLLASITGGTDICSLFAGMNSALPVYRGELQCKMLGMAIDAYTPTGQPAGPGEAGELVCTRPFPCQPAGFWPLPGFGAPDEEVAQAKARYRQAYFGEYEGIWFHGDHVAVMESRGGNGGGIIMLGRSDGVLNPGGVRFGSAELYDVIEQSFAFKGPHELADRATPDPDAVVVDCLAVGQTIANGTDERVVLFLQLVEGASLAPALEARIKSEIRKRRSARHVPARILVAPVPYTLNGKRVEVPVKKIINGAPVASINAATLRNPEVLAQYVTIGERLRAEVP